MNLMSFALYSVGQLVGGLHLAARLDVLEEFGLAHGLPT